MDVLEQLAAEPGGEELLACAPANAFLVGGAVRDLLLERRPRELDVVIEDTTAPFGAAVTVLAGRLAARLGAHATAGTGERNRLSSAREHARFGTASVQWPAGRIDIAAARREHYPAPGALPEVQAAPLTEDLLRRDFTVNALALGLGGGHRGVLQAAPGALEDLHAKRLRVLHDQSFVEDPTRLWRLARYRARLGFAVEQHTAQLAASAVAEGALQCVSGARLGAELRLALAEADAVGALVELERVGALAALHPRVRFEAPLARRALELLPRDGRRDLLLLATLVLPLALRADGDPRAEVAALLDRLEFGAADRDRVGAAAAAVPRLVEELPRAATPSRLHAVAVAVPPEGVAVTGAVSAPALPAARRWLEEVRGVRLRITGEDLLAGGLTQGPEIGRRLEQTLRKRLDGELPDDRDAQLRAALG
jgi:tRNA nucleotidyltransferase (CCA-adding enzyme)